MLTVTRAVRWPTTASPSCFLSSATTRPASLTAAEVSLPKMPIRQDTPLEAPQSALSRRFPGFCCRRPAADPGTAQLQNDFNVGALAKVLEVVSRHLHLPRNDPSCLLLMMRSPRLNSPACLSSVWLSWAVPPAAPNHSRTFSGQFDRPQRTGKFNRLTLHRVGLFFASTYIIDGSNVKNPIRGRCYSRLTQHACHVVARDTLSTSK
jgi:hypothetical protein